MKCYAKYPLREIFHNVQELNSLAEWASYLSAYNIIFEPHNIEKGHALASLLIDFPIDIIDQQQDEHAKDIQMVEPPTDGGSLQMIEPSIGSN